MSLSPCWPAQQSTGSLPHLLGSLHSSLLHCYQESLPVLQGHLAKQGDPVKQGTPAMQENPEK